MYSIYNRKWNIPVKCLCYHISWSRVVHKHKSYIHPSDVCTLLDKNEGKSERENDKMSQQGYHKKYSGTGFLVGSPLTSCTGTSVCSTINQWQHSMEDFLHKGWLITTWALYVPCDWLSASLVFSPLPQYSLYNTYSASNYHREGLQVFHTWLCC